MVVSNSIELKSNGPINWGKPYWVGDNARECSLRKDHVKNGSLLFDQRGNICFQRMQWT
jgi:hypothetical protein